MEITINDPFLELSSFEETRWQGTQENKNSRLNSTELRSGTADDFAIKPSLYVQKISPFNYGRTEKIAAIWERIALEKADLATNEKEKKQFKACALISSWLSSNLESPSYDESYTNPRK
jgi:hypothetical protein